ncbi:metallopeptidase family protein [Novosphingobium sp. Fuku2-ISO-50]|uniref:metallopeptidase family protein n=1 Tax=Novosphingobium sp. Fuku2-ISO-50 TaxID=1739114 RepID=UPI000A87FEC4|nr:metallopeptidase family protein [Novosphingobium sp. Fuku2-ISO-50]MDR3530088.1 metallopeptidase family protein [Rhodopila sp.]
MADTLAPCFNLRWAPHIVGMSNHLIHTPDAAALEHLAHRAVRALPPIFRDHLGDVVFRVQDFADSEMLRAVGLSDPWALLGLYHGRPFGQQSIWSTGEMPSIISLFRRPILAECHRRGVSINDMVTHVIVHEVGHHFGLSDADMHRIEDES